jgi:hypothetical protein
MSIDEYEKTLGTWLGTNTKNYKNNSQGMMKKCGSRRRIWTDFLEEYENVFVSLDDKWDTNFEKLKEFIINNNRTPSSKPKNSDEKILGTWLGTQNHNYKNSSKGMKECGSRRRIWTDFLEEHKKLFVSLDDKWDSNLQILKEFIIKNDRTPSNGSKNSVEKNIGKWLGTQTQNYKNKKNSLKDVEKYDMWTKFLEEFKEHHLSSDDKWNANFGKLKEFVIKNNRPPSSHSDNNTEKVIGYWFGTQQQGYKKNIMNDERFHIWSDFIKEHLTKGVKSVKSMDLKNTTKKTEEIVKETTEQKKQRTKSQMEILHQRYKTLSSSNLNKEFSDNSNLWNEYHEMSEQNEESFPREGIPRNIIIEELEKQKTKRTKTVVDMGCGRAQISKHFTDKNDTRFQFINYDHVSSNKTVISCDISSTPLENDSVEIVILSLAMWGSNCKTYIAEAHRILESNGLLYIIEATKRWSEKDENHNFIQGEEGGKLKKVLIDNHFQVSESKIEKFSLFVCNKRQII